MSIFLRFVHGTHNHRVAVERAPKRPSTASDYPLPAHYDREVRPYVDLQGAGWDRLAIRRSLDGDEDEGAEVPAVECDRGRPFRAGPIWQRTPVTAARKPPEAAIAS